MAISLFRKMAISLLTVESGYFDNLCCCGKGVKFNNSDMELHWDPQIYPIEQKIKITK